jgi:hypothetical protein
MFVNFVTNGWNDHLPFGNSSMIGCNGDWMQRIRAVTNRPYDISYTVAAVCNRLFCKFIVGAFANAHLCFQICFQNG